jgi:hypothetical protein
MQQVACEGAGQTENNAKESHHRISRAGKSLPQQVVVCGKKVMWKRA